MPRERAAQPEQQSVSADRIKGHQFGPELTAQVSSSRRCPVKATPRQLIKVGPAKGLDRKPIAPAFSARARLVSSGKAVMNMNGARWPCARIVVKSSRPFMPGICRSAMTHDVSFKRPDRRKCSADGYASTIYPCDFRNLLVAARTDASSSTTEITETVDKRRAFLTREPTLVQYDGSGQKCGANQHFKIILRFARSRI